MGEETSSRSSNRLLSPIFLIALTLLIVNDHVLKGSGLLPGWLTGKLSDFAGLLVLPVLLCETPQLRTGLARALVCLAVGSLFAAVNLSPVAALELDRALAGIGIASRLWADPTDLAALPVLWLAFNLRPARWGAPVPYARAVAVIAAVACLGTTDSSDKRAYDTARDVDNDGFSEGEDCDDRDPTINPGATETCVGPARGDGMNLSGVCPDGVDEDCDGVVDEGCAFDNRTRSAGCSNSGVDLGPDGSFGRPLDEDSGTADDTGQDAG